MVLVSVLFGYGHYYKGPSGIVDSGVAGLIRGAAYLLSGRNLWASILARRSGMAVSLLRLVGKGGLSSFDDRRLWIIATGVRRSVCADLEFQNDWAYS